MHIFLLVVQLSCVLLSVIVYTTVLYIQCIDQYNYITSNQSCILQNNLYTHIQCLTMFVPIYPQYNTVYMCAQHNHVCISLPSHSTMYSYTMMQL